MALPFVRRSINANKVKMFSTIQPLFGRNVCRSKSSPSCRMAVPQLPCQVRISPSTGRPDTQQVNLQKIVHPPVCLQSGILFKSSLTRFVGSSRSLPEWQRLICIGSYRSANLRHLPVQSASQDNLNRSSVSFSTGTFPSHPFGWWFH